LKRNTAPICVVLLAAFFLSAAWPVFGQGNLGAITGTVLDSSGAVVPDLPLTITNVETGVKWTATTSSAGYYRVAVPPGTYRLEAQKQGFKTHITDKILVPVAQVVTVDLTLQVGNQAEKVEVTSQAPLLTPSTAEVSAAVGPQEYETLPIEVDDGGRQLQSFIFRSLPGAVGDTFSGSINGGQLFSHEILIDGVTIGRYDLSGGSLDEFSPGTDAIAEFKVQSSNYSAEYGETGGGIANFSYKSGTNDFHGTLFEYNKNPVFNAAGVLASAGQAPKDNHKENNFGGTIGGPIRKDHTFFFFDYEGDRLRSFLFNGTVTLPTPAMKSGDFSSWLGTQNFCGPDPNNPQPCFDALGRPVFENEIYDPTTTRKVTANQVDPVTGRTATSNATIRDPFQVGTQLNVIPAGEFSSTSSVLLSLFPDPVFAKDTRNTPRFSGCCPILSRNAYTGKIDHVLTSKQKLWASYTWNHRDRYNRNGRSFPPFPGQPINPVKRQIVGGPQVRIAHAWTISSRSVNEFSVGYNRFQNKNNITNNATFTPQLGIPGIPNDCFPPFHFKGHVGQLPSTLGVGCKNIDPSESYVYQDTFSYLRGKHSMKFGGEFRRYRYNTFEPGPLSGEFTFTDRETSLPGFTSNTGHPFASFLLGAVQSGSRSVYTTEPGYRAGLYAFFAQDDFKFSPKLTLNLGLRWEIPVPQREVLNRESGFDPTVPNPGADNIPGALVFLGSCSVCNHRNSFQDWYFKEFGPRIGLAYQFYKNLVFRGGYGISYGPPIENNFGSQNLFGFNGGVSLIKGTSPTGFPQDPVTYWSTLKSAPLPATAQVGVPAFTGTLPNRDPASANGQTLDFMPRNAAAQPYAQNWSAGLQYLFPHDIMLQADYVGSKGTRLLNGYFGFWYNQAPSKFMALGDILADDLATDLADPVNGPILASFGITGLPYPDFENNNYDTSVGAAVQPFPQYFGLVNNYPTIGNSTYHSLQLMGRKTAAHGLSFIAAYTFSKTLTDTDSALYASGSQVVQDFYNRKAEKAIASFDFPQFLKLTWIYELPFGHERKWLNNAGGLDRLVSGWQLTAIQNYFSGDPLVIIDSSVSAGIQFNGIRADIVPGVPLTVPNSGLNVVNGTQYLNPNAFTDPPLSPGNSFALRPGNSPGFLPRTRGPGHSSEDFGIVKNTRLSERTALQLRADMFNVFNRTGRGDPDTDLADGNPFSPQGGTFGMITDPGQGPRIIQFALRLTF
jgi:carboxypeptidase family protein/TonB-dependent receptor-like protein